MKRFGWFRSVRSILPRAFLVFVGTAAVAWGLAALSLSWGAALLSAAATRIIEGDPPTNQGLLDLIPTLETFEKSSYCNPRAVRSAAIIRLRILENAFSGGVPTLIAADLSDLRSSIHTALECSPADSFLWLVLYSVQTQIGCDANCGKYLRLSYQFGPNEGWIAIKRNPLMFSIFDRLPPDVAQQVIDEFKGFVRTGWYDEAARIFAGPAWPVHEIIVSQIEEVSLRDRQAFARALQSQDHNVAIPGVDPPNERPWH